MKPQAIFYFALFTAGAVTEAQLKYGNVSELLEQSITAQQEIIKNSDLIYEGDYNGDGSTLAKEVASDMYKQYGVAYFGTGAAAKNKLPTCEKAVDLYNSWGTGAINMANALVKIADFSAMATSEKDHDSNKISVRADRFDVQFALFGSEVQTKSTFSNRMQGACPEKEYQEKLDEADAARRSSLAKLR